MLPPNNRWRGLNGRWFRSQRPLVMRVSNTRRRWLALALLVPLVTNAGDIAWPDLPKTCFVKGRPATEDDLTKGCAAFVIKVQGKVSPLDIEIPQYAIHVEDGTGKETRVIIIQAEEGQGIQTVGFIIVGTSSMGASLLREVRLLGTKKPVSTDAQNPRGRGR